MKKIIFSTFTLFAFTATSFGQAKVVLNKNQKFIATTSAIGTTSMEMMGQSMETSTESSAVSTIEVKDVMPAGYKLTTTVTKVKVKSKGGMGQDVNFDSDNKEDMDTEIGKSVKDELKPKDEEIDLLGKNAGEKNGTSDDDISKVMQSLNGTGNNGVAGNFILIPAGKKAGDAWMDSSNANGVKISNTYTFKQLTGKDATVDVNTISKINKTVQAQGADVTIIMDLKVLSTDIVDITTGVIKLKKTTAEGKGTLNAGGQEIPMNSKVTSETTIKNM
jgi:hypothetical protein